jgi:hypothetical protein
MTARPPPTPVLNIRELYGRRQTRDASRLTAYNSLLHQIHHRIKVSSQLPTHPTSLTFTVPPFILGLPKLDLEDCIVYLVYQLRTSGFEVKYTYPNMLYISWAHHEHEYLINESPILKAMIDTADAVAPPKKKSKQPKSILRNSVKFADDVQQPAQQLQFNPRAAPPPPPMFSMHNAAPAAPRNALEYVPPVEFINSIERTSTPTNSPSTMQSSKRNLQFL